VTFSVLLYFMTDTVRLRSAFEVSETTGMMMAGRGVMMCRMCA
jgi:hypothetical protein